MRRTRSWLLAVTVGVVSAGSLGAACGSSPAMRAAERGDYAALRGEIAARHTKGQLSNEEAADLGKAVAKREIQVAKGQDAVERVRDVRACAIELDGVLAERMKTKDDAGAEAALARLESGELDDDDAREYANDADPAWRAVGARGLVRAEDRGPRQKGFVDGSPKVRRQAVRAAQKAKDVGDSEALLEVARVDPEPMIRTEAVRALAQLAPHGRVDLANRLRDLWATADDPLREDIAFAWSSPDLYATGGREALRLHIAQTSGPGAVEASWAVLRDWEKRDREMVQLATGHVVRAIESGSQPRRMQAIAVARVNPRCTKSPTSICDDPAADMLEAIVKASQEDDAEIRVSALSRLLENPKHKGESIKQLEVVAGQKGHPLQSRAKFALASAGHVKVQAWVEEDLTAGDAHTKLAAASALSAMGRSARAAPLLADADAAVRTRAACALIMGARSRR
jgi:hypothetical protein